MNNDLISIIIPAYNNGIYINKCIESILNQTYRNIEIIIINDCSTDNTEDIIKKYLTKDNRIAYYYNEKNMGVGYTRNKGIELAKGKYIYFLDSDDYIEPTAISDLYNGIKEKDSFCCTTLGFKEINGERESFDKPIYTYVIHSDSLSHKSSEYRLDVLKAVDSIEKYAKERNQYDKFYERLEFINISHILLSTTKRIKSFDGYNQDDIKKCLEIVNEKYPNWKENKYINRYLSGNKEYLLNL